MPSDELVRETIRSLPPVLLVMPDEEDRDARLAYVKAVKAAESGENGPLSDLLDDEGDYKFSMVADLLRRHSLVPLRGGRRRPMYELPKGRHFRLAWAVERYRAERAKLRTKIAAAKGRREKAALQTKLAKLSASVADRCKIDERTLRAAAEGRLGAFNRFRNEMANLWPFLRRG